MGSKAGTGQWNGRRNARDWDDSRAKCTCFPALIRREDLLQQKTSFGECISLSSNPASILPTHAALPELFSRPTCRHRTANQRSDVLSSLSQAIFSPASPFSLLRQPDRVQRPQFAVSMSDIQQFLLDYDRNRREASEVARQSATRMYQLGDV